MNLENLDKILMDEPKYRKIQASEAVFKDLIADWNNASNLPLNLREKLKKYARLKLRARLKKLIKMTARLRR